MSDRTESPVGAAYAVGEDRGAIRLIDYWRILVRRKYVVIGGLAGTVAIALLATLLMTPQFRATSTIQIERQGSDIFSFKDVLGSESVSYLDFYKTQYKILESRTVLRAAAERIDLPNRPELVGRGKSPIRRMIRWSRSLFGGSQIRPDELDRSIEFIAENLSVHPVDQSHLVRISFVDRDPRLARDVSNAVVDAYRQFNLDTRYSKTAQAAEFLTKQVAQLQREIADKQFQLQEYGDKNDILATNDDSQNMTSQALADLTARLVAAKGRLSVAEARNDSVRNAEPVSLPEVLNSPLIRQLRQSYAEAEMRHGTMARRFGSNWPALQQVEEELRQSGERLLLEMENIANQVRSVVQADYERARAEVAGLEQYLDAQKTEVQRFNRDSIEYASLKAEIQTKRIFLDELVNRRSETEVSDRLRDTRASNIRVIDRAETPKLPSKPNKTLNLLLSLFLGVTLGVGGALVLDHLDNTVKDEADIARMTALPILGRVSMYRPLRVVGEAPPNRSNGKLDPVDIGSHLDPHSPFAEAFKNLRTTILLASAEHPPRHIVVTSSEPGDGKSTISANLAITLAQAGRRVLLVDADLRRPRMHVMFGLDNEIGLSNFLTGNAELREVLRETLVPGLSAMTSGPIPPTPSELLGSSRLQTMLDRLGHEEVYDHVIFDSTPSLQVADSVTLSAWTDATILVVRARKTARETLIQGVARLRQSRANVVGVVLNAVPDQASYYFNRSAEYIGGENADTRRVKHRRSANS